MKQRTSPDHLSKIAVNPELVEQVVQRAVEVQQIPAPPFHEDRRSAHIYELFQAEGLADVSTDELGNVYARIPGAGHSQPVIISAHMDTVFPLDTDLALRRDSEQLHGPGIGDNSLGIASLFGLVWGLRQFKRQPAGDIWLVANVGEEGLGDLRGMRAVVERFSNTPLAYIVLEGMALGQVYHRGLGVSRYQISVQTDGGHSWVDYGRPSAIHELAALMMQITALPVPASPRTTMNIGVVSGGTGINVIAAHAQLELDLRSEDAGILVELSQLVEMLCHRACRQGVKVKWEIIGQRPAGEIPPTHPLVALAERCLSVQGLQPRLAIGSTDANIPLSLGMPAITLGITTGHSAHTLEETINIIPIAKGLAQLIQIVGSVFEELQEPSAYHKGG